VQELVDPLGQVEREHLVLAAWPLLALLSSIVTVGTALGIVGTLRNCPLRRLLVLLLVTVVPVPVELAKRGLNRRLRLLVPFWAVVSGLGCLIGILLLALLHL